MKYKPEITDESPVAIPVTGEIAVRGAGRAQNRGIKDPSDSYGQDEPERVDAEREGR